MEFRYYTDGKKSIRATPAAYEMIYKAQGFKPMKAGGNNDKSASNRRDTPKDTVAETDDDKQ